jgi:phosphopantetheinyl transferase (holo-ACP synthase)
MLSAGNDIVDLGIINTERTTRPNFYSKFITGTEIALHQPLQLPLQHFVWLLWSVKESVYKFVQRHQPDLVFSPSKILIPHIDIPTGLTGLQTPQPETQGKRFENYITYKCTVTFGQDTFYSRSIINSGYILTTVNNADDFGNIYWGVKSIDNDAPENQSALVRQFALARLAQVTGCSDIAIHKNTAGVPTASSQNQQINIPLSLSHHGCYVAYAFCIMQ